MTMTTTNNIDEINAYSNGDGSFQVEILVWGTDKDDNPSRMVVTIPSATLDLSISSGFNTVTELEFTLRGVMEK